MTLFDIFEYLIIYPLKLVFEVIFSEAYYVTENPGISIIALSLVMNILVLPLYRQADAMQEKARDTDARLRKGVDHIKKTFSGDERMMILQTYYRQNNYRPTDALSGSISLLLEIPFFMAAYQFLSHAVALQNVSFGPIQNLGAPDGLLVIGGIAINLLPILMTLINCISSALYLKGFPLKTKIQLYGMAMFFLVFLYVSPSGLVFYWTLNNLFSLVKNIFYKLKNPRKVLRGLLFAVGVALLTYALFGFNHNSIKVRIMVVVMGLGLMCPVLLKLLHPFLSRFEKKAVRQIAPKRSIFVLGGLFLTLLIGALIPSAVIVSSPQEFIDMGYFYHPLWYIANATTLAAGAFLVWMGVFYWLADDRWKVRFQQLMCVLCGVALVDYLFFGTNMGTLSSSLEFLDGVHISAGEKLVNLAVVLAVALVLYLIVKKYSRSVIPVLLTAIIAVASMTGLNMVQIKQSVDSGTYGSFNLGLQLPLSRSGKNVVVLMLDRALGEYVPYLLQEKPELAEEFDGFTYYPNTISYGRYTNICTPAFFGGYEYTPVELNRRPDTSLKEKQNEALKIMPSLFADNGSKVTVCDPVYANYQWTPDLTIYDDDPRIQAYNTRGMFFDAAQKEQLAVINRRNFFMYGVMKVTPLALQPYVYFSGTYHNPSMGTNISPIQTITSMSQATGISTAFTDCYNVLLNLPSITSISDDAADTFLMMTNDATHEPMLLQTPDYVPADHVDNTKYDAAHADRFRLNGKTLIMENNTQMIHYHANMATMLRLAEWFDYLRENGVYDNTRIVLASDHGRGLEHQADMYLGSGSKKENLEFYLPLLMVKDFDSHGFTTSEEFMTIADVPVLAMEDLIENPVNPFTGKPINSDEKQAHEQFVCMSREWHTNKNGPNTFLPCLWASVKDNPWELDNWTLYDQECVLDRHAAP